MIAALSYLTRRSMLNAVRARARRLRRPRYLLVALGLVVYVASMMINRPPDGVLGMVPLGGTRASVVAAAVATLIMALAWVLPTRVALRFTPAEVHFLFAAPVTRRQLIGYKIVRLLIGSVGGGALFALFLAPLRAIDALLFAGRSALVLATLTLHEAGVSLYRSNAKDHGGLRGRRRLTAIAAAFVLTPLIAWVLARVALAATFQEFLRWLPVALTTLGANVVWVLQSDAAFEESAAQNAEKLQRALARGGRVQARPPRVRSTPFALAAAGPVETAILWKNWLLFGRASGSSLVVSIVVLGSVGAGLFFAIVPGSKGGMAAAVSVFLAALAGLVTLMGPVMLRMDLRQDLAYLAVFKSWPVRGAEIVRGETLAPAIVLSAVAAGLIAFACTLSPSLPWQNATSAAARAIVALSGIAVAAAIIVAQLVVQNGLAVAFPAWTPVTRSGVAGLEIAGHMMVAMYGAMFIVAVAAIVPSAAAAAVFVVAGGTLAPSAVFAIVLLAESLVATEAIGRLLERTDLQDVVAD